MRILKTTQTYYPYLSKGGPPLKVRGLANGLVRRGHEVTVLTADLGEAEGFSDIGNGIARKQSEWGWESHLDGVHAIYLTTLANYRATTINLRLTSFCTKYLRDYDVVHVYGLYDLIGATVAWFSRRRGVPYVLEPLGMFGSKIRSQHKKRLYKQVVGNTLIEGAEGVIATSEREREELIAGGIPAGKVILRRNGIDLNEFQVLPERGAFRAKAGISENERLVLFLGRLSFIKGLDLLVQAWSEIKTEARLVIAGPDDDDGCLQRVQGLINELNLEDRVILAGALYGSDKLQALVDADFLVLPSRYESFGNAAAESIASGTPVLVTDQCGIATLVKNVGGLEVECNIESLRQGMSRLIHDESLLLTLRDGCALVGRNLSWDTPVEEMESLYKKIADCGLRIADLPTFAIRNS